MISTATVISKLAYAHQALLEDLGGCLLQLGQKRLFDGRCDLAVVMLGIISNPTGLAAELRLVRGKIQPQNQPEQEEYRDDYVDSSFGRLHCHNGVVYVYLDVCLKTIQ